MAAQLDIFISSRLKELKPEREALYEFLPTLHYGDTQVHAWVFEEDAPASGKPSRDVYLRALQNSSLYLGLFWNGYGEWTIDEFESATRWGMERHVFVKDVDSEHRDPRLVEFLQHSGDVQSGITAKWFKTTADLCNGVKNSIDSWMRERVQSHPGATSAVLAHDPNDLTERARQLIGRDDLLRKIDHLLAGHEQVLLQGMGGMGKTALAAAAAANWIANGRGDVLWLRAGSTSVDAQFEALARPFNAHQTIAQQTGDARIQAVRHLLHESGVKLLVLDDCWNGQALFQVAKAVPLDIPLLVTARQRYALDNIVDVGELHPDDARKLLAYHSKIETVDDAAKQLCQTLGNHAFAIEIAGKTLKAQKQTPAELLASIKDTPHTLKMPGDFNERERSSITDLLDASINALDQTARKVFLSCGAFFAPTTAVELLGLYLEDTAVDEALMSLHDYGLVERIPPTEEAIAHYRLHDLAYSYARVHAADAQHHKALDALMAYLERHSESNPPNLAALRPELDNFMGAASWALAAGRYEDVEQIAQVLYNAQSGILGLQGFYALAATLLKQAAEAAAKRGNYDGQTHNLRHLSMAYLLLARYQESIEYSQLALDLARNTGNQLAEANALSMMANACYRMGQTQRAIEHYEQALTISRALENRPSEAAQLGNLGNVYSDLKQHQQAIDYLRRAYDLFTEIGNVFAQGMCLGNLGLAYANSGDRIQAVDYYERALVVQRQIGDKGGQGNQLGNLGFLYYELKDFPKSIDYTQQSMAISREIGDERGEGIGYGNLGKVYSDLGQYEQAIECLQQSLAIHRKIGYRLGEGETLADFGEVYRRMGQYQQAIDHFRESREIYAAFGVLAEAERIDNLLVQLQSQGETGQ